MEVFLLVEPWLLATTYAMPRFLVMFSILPLMTKETLPPLLRFAVVGSLAVIVVPGLTHDAHQDRAAIEALAIIVKEGFIGLVLGFVFAIPLWAFDAMGDFVDTQRGANMAQTLNPLSGQESSPLGQLFAQAITVLLFVGGGFTAMTAAVYQSFAVWPVFSALPPFGDDAPAAMLGLLDKLLHLAVLLSAPVIFAMFIAEAGLAIVSRFAPQLQVFFLAMPVKSGLAMLVFALYAVILFDHAQDLLLATARGALDTLGRVLVPGAPR